MVVTHHLPLEEGPKGYKIFNDKAEGCIKVVLKPGTSTREQ
jgi:threonine dehydrogenase-like Zn-dependent dehydrogenase